MTEKADSLTTGHELGTMVAQVGGMHASAEPILDQDHFRMFAKSLKPGNAYILLTGTNVLPEGTRRRALDQTDHYVVLGKDASGSIFLYDPWPRVGHAAAAIRGPELLDAVLQQGRRVEGQLHLRAPELLSA